MFDMKKILSVVALLAVAISASAQLKSVAEAKKQMEAAEAASQNPKKAEKAATWLKLGQTYVAAYEAPQGAIYNGASKDELKLLTGGKLVPLSTSRVKIGDQRMEKQMYTDKNLYFNKDGKLALIEITRPVAEGLLGKAADAYSKAYSLEPKKAKEVSEAFTNIGGKYFNEGITHFNLGRNAEASKAFENASAVTERKPLEKIDTSAVYYAGITANLAGDKERAKGFFEKCYGIGYYADKGDVFAMLASVDTLNRKKYLEEGFSKFPDNQRILIELINHYLKTNADPKTLFVLLDKAKTNEPKNASLYYVEGDAHEKLGSELAAIAAYRKCAEIDPTYEWGYYAEGRLYYNKAVEIQKKGEKELDDVKYMALASEMSTTLRNCIEPFEKAYEVSKNAELKKDVAGYLKNVYFRFRNEKEEYKQAYEKYDAIVKGTAK